MIPSQVIKAAEQMDWGQVVLNGGPPCFYLDTDGRFCGRAERWVGHWDLHDFISLADLLKHDAKEMRDKGAV